MSKISKLFLKVWLKCSYQNVVMRSFKGFCKFKFNHKSVIMNSNLKVTSFLYLFFIGSASARNFVFDVDINYFYEIETMLNWYLLKSSSLRIPK